MNLKRILFVIAVVLFTSVQQTAKAQTTLVAGDILFTGYNGIPSAGIAPDTFSFVILTPISTGTVIYFTERGYQGASVWQASGGTEGTISWTSGSALAVGQEVEIAGFGASAARINGVPNGTVAIVAGGNVTTGLSLSNAGDQVIAFQGGAGNPASGTMISGISWALSCGTTTVAGWNGAGCTYGPQSSTIPPGLTGGVNAFLAGNAGAAPNNDHGKFNCNGTPYASVASLKTAILTLSNWVFSSTGVVVYDLPAACGSFYASCSNPTINTAPSNTSVCNTANTSFTIAATGATGYQWQVNTGSGFTNIVNGAPYSNATTASLTITGATSGMNGYLYRCVASNGACNTTSSSATLTVSTPSVTALSQTNISCFGGATGAAAVNIPTGGIAPYTYNWSPGNPSGDGTTSVTGLTATTWTCTVTDNIGCPATRNFTITEPVSTPGTNSYSLPSANQTVTKTVNNFNYVSGSCELVNAVVASGASPVAGSVTNKVWIESSVPVQAGQPFVQRHYEITPASNPTTSTGTVTLYFTQAEFDNFNAHAASTLNLPTGAGDAAGKANLRIGKYSGTSGNGTGLPASYSGSTMVIDPVDTDIVWNATSSAWEVTFTVSGFSGFILQSVSATLPVSMVSFDVRQQGKGISINWSTASEQNSLDFYVQHSSNGTDWTTIAVTAAAGNSSSLKTYRFTHDNPVNGMNYYRVQQNDQDGKKSYSETKTIRFKAVSSAVQVLVNPVQNGQLQLTVNTNLQTIRLYNSHGQLLQSRQLTAGTHTLNVSSFAKGIYWLKAGKQQAEKIMIE